VQLECGKVKWKASSTYACCIITLLLTCNKEKPTEKLLQLCHGPSSSSPYATHHMPPFPATYVKLTATTAKTQTAPFLILNMYMCVCFYVPRLLNANRCRGNLPLVSSSAPFYAPGCCIRRIVASCGIHIL